jgi:hypothetical protein
MMKQLKYPGQVANIFKRCNEGFNSRRLLPFIANAISFRDKGNTKHICNVAQELAELPRRICNVIKSDFIIFRTSRKPVALIRPVKRVECALEDRE